MAKNLSCEINQSGTKHCTRRGLLAGFAAGGLLLAAGPALAQDDAIIGRWEGAAQLPDYPLGFVVTFSRSPAGALTGAMDIADAGVFQLPLQDVVLVAGRVRFGMPYNGAAVPFESELRGDRLTGQMTFGSITAPFGLTRQPPAPPPYAEQAVTIAHGDVRLNGALFVPRGRGPHPAIVFQQASRPDNRQQWLYWADLFARNGVAGLVWDSRGAGGPRGAPWSDFADVAADGAAAVRLLKGRREIDARKIGLFAVSQGGWIAPMVAARDRSVAFIAMVSGPGIPMARCVLYEARKELEGAGLAPADVAAGVGAKERFERMILDGASDDALDAFRASVQDRPWFPRIGLLPRDHWHRGWWRRNGGHDPAPYWARVRAPVLDLYGDRDVEVPVAESIAAMEAAYRSRGARRLTTRVFPADHSLRTVRGGLPVRVPGAIDMLTTWVRARTGLA